ncbi:hypothetical protein B484DRAFT_340891, partial [Ochromonadaceae sp. CCMP2298]
WLNDETVSFLFCCLAHRDKCQCITYTQRRPSHYFNSFFIDQLLNIKDPIIARRWSYTYYAVRRWSRKFSLFQYVYIPININMIHWTLAVVFVQEQRIHYYDSMSQSNLGSGKVYLRAILQWVADTYESDPHTKGLLDLTPWRLVLDEPVPQQVGGWDCGVFTIMCADFLSDNLPLTHSQGNIADYRIKIGAVYSSWLSMSLKLHIILVPQNLLFVPY